MPAPEDTAEALATLVARRLLLPLAPRTDVARLLHGRGGAWPGFEDVVVDRYGGTLRIGLHGDRPAHWVETLRAALADALDVDALDADALDADAPGAHARNANRARASGMLEGVWLQWRGVAGQRARTGAYLGTDPGADAGPNPGAPSGAGSGSGSGSDNEPDAGLRADPGSDTRGPGAGIRVERLWGAPREALDVQERGLRYRVHPGLHRNAGLFLDAAPARAWLRETAAGLRVLNLFAYTCSFSVAALAGGARDVVNLDMAAGALAIGRHNHRLNALAGATFLSHELFRSWGALRRRGPFDLVVVDPPSFQRGSFEADRHWPRLLGRLPGLLSGSGRVLVCLNSPFHGLDQLDAWRQDHAPGLFLQESLPRSPQFPEVDPDRGLKVQVWSAAVSPAPAAARRA